MNLADGGKLQGAIQTEAERKPQNKEIWGAAQLPLQGCKHKEGGGAVQVGVGTDSRDGKDLGSNQQRAVQLERRILDFQQPAGNGQRTLLKDHGRAVQQEPEMLPDLLGIGGKLIQRIAQPQPLELKRQTG